MQEESNTADKMVVQDKRSIYYIRYPNLAIYYCLTMASGHYLPILYHSSSVTFAVVTHQKAFTGSLSKFGHSANILHGKVYGIIVASLLMCYKAQPYTPPPFSTLTI